MKDNVFLSNYKTTITGLAGLIVTIVSVLGIVKDPHTLNLINNVAVGILGIAISLLGYFSTDADHVMNKIAKGLDVAERVEQIINSNKENK